MNERLSARALLLNDQEQILLIKHEDAIPVDAANPNVLHYWATPGGGVEKGERHEEALRRELQEELGLKMVDIGRLIGVRRIELDLPMQGTILSVESYFVCRTYHSFQLNYDGLSGNERRVLKAVRWWSLEELRDPKTFLRPPALPNLVEMAVRDNSDPIFLLD